MKTQFDPDQAIEDWRGTLRQSPAFCRENLDELEAHLRDSAVALEARGLSAEEAFMVAVRRIGRGDSLGIEFTKVNGQAVWFDRVLWVLIGFQLSLLVFDACRTIAAFGALPTLDGSSVLGIYALLTGGLVERSAMTNSGLAMPLMTAVIAWSVWKFSQDLESPAPTFFAELLNRPLVLAFAFLLLGMIMHLLATAFFVFMFSKPSGPFVAPGFGVPTTFPIGANFFNQLPQYAVCALLTMFVARKRLRLNSL